MPAQAACTGSGEHHPGLPALLHDDVQAVDAPHRSEVGHAAALDQKDVMREQVLADIGHVRLVEQREDAEDHVRSPCSELLSLGLDDHRGVANDGGEVADALPRLLPAEPQRVIGEVTFDLVSPSERRMPEMAKICGSVVFTQGP